MNSNVSLSVRNETKAKFDSLLKAALKKKRRQKCQSKSKQNLVSESDSEIESAPDEVIEVDVYVNDADDKTYIMDKFLHDSNQVEQDQMQESADTFIKPPVPKPRRNKTRNGSDLNSGTYIKSKSGSGLSNTTYDSKELESYTNEAIEMSEFPQEIPVPIQEEIETDIDKISYENEIKPKPKKRIKVKERGNEEEIIRKQWDYSKITNIAIHRTDRLQLDSYVIHPVIKIHLVDADRGEYLKKSDKNRNALFYYENKDCDYIGPVMTQSYSLQENRSLHPNWEEVIIINEDFAYISGNHSVIILFEVLDFLSASVINQANLKDSQGWHKIAWAFLKLTTPSYSNTEKKLRLQLYYPHKPRKQFPPEKCDILHWWQKKKFNKYPSTLYVTVRGASAPKEILQTIRSCSFHQSETARSKIDAVSNADVEENGSLSKARSESVRSSAHICKIPNELEANLNAEDHGCFLMKFSTSGKQLACCVVDGDFHVIIIYSMNNYEEMDRLQGHQGLIYGLNWSEDDSILVSASADCIVCVWDVINFKFIQMLPHPNYVYSSILNKKIIITGCFDNYVRIWVKNEIKYELADELREHKGYITCLCFNREGNFLFSSDSLGVILIWKQNENEWILKKEIKILDIKDTAINQILLHKKERRLLINSRDDKIRMVDIKTGFVLHTYHGAVNHRFHMYCCFSSCGNYVFSGSENGLLHVWNTDTGNVEVIFQPFNEDIAIHCVDFHPKINLIAVSHYGQLSEILLFKHNKKETSGETKPDTLRSRSREKIGNDNLNFKEILHKMDSLLMVKE